MVAGGGGGDGGGHGGVLLLVPQSVLRATGLGLMEHQGSGAFGRCWLLER